MINFINYLKKIKRQQISEMCFYINVNTDRRNR